MLNSYIYIYIYTPLPPKKNSNCPNSRYFQYFNLKIRKCQRNARVKTDKGVQPGNWSTISLYEVFEDTKGVIRIHKSKNDRQDTTPLPLPIINKKTNNDLQNITHKTLGGKSKQYLFNLRRLSCIKCITISYSSGKHWWKL
jgi:hypothetical protein